LVVGEPQILGQVKEAVRIAGEAKSLGVVLNRLTQRTMWVAKHIRTNTAIGRFNVGIGNAGVFLSQQIFSTLRGRRALLIGVGEMGRQVAKAMLNAGIGELLVANRTPSRSIAMAEEFGATALRYEHVSDYLHRVDIVITATGAARPILGVSDIKAAMRVRRYRPLFLVDLAVPRNIAPAVEGIPQAYLFNVDDLTAVMERGRKAREEASREAERIVTEETKRFAERLATLEVNDALGEVIRQMDDLRRGELERSRKLLDELTEAQRASVEAMTKALVKKVLHRPLLQIRHAVRDGDVQKAKTLLKALSDPDEPR
jgi:glutamyl-tRNA reductase